MKGLKRRGKNKRAGALEELSEEEVWSVIDESGSGQTREAGGSGEERSSQQQSRQKSAPVNIPESRRRSEDDGNKKDGDGDDEEERLPPHEYLAREHARSETAFQGVGRNGKSRDLTVRNAIWRRTGFSG
ncbi:hypothetical protein SUGI_0627590 [Cryptomeria japonica]|nr:hypothetical protein SUGI_0627590 [Cryptomeria japonica]